MDGLTIPLSQEIQEIMAELSADDHGSSHKADKTKLQKKTNVRVESVNVSTSSSSDSVDLNSIERRLKSLVQSAMNPDQK